MLGGAGVAVWLSRRTAILAQSPVGPGMRRSRFGKVQRYLPSHGLPFYLLRIGFAGP